MKKLLLISLFFLIAFLEGNATNYYTRVAGGKIANVLSDWTTDPDGLPGISPANFTAAGDIFNLTDDMTTTAQWDVTGSGSKVIIPAAIRLTTSHNNTITVEMQGSGRITQTGIYSNLIFGTLSTLSLFELKSNPLTDLRLDLTYRNLLLAPTADFIGRLPGNLNVNNNLTLTLTSASELYVARTGGAITWNIGGNLTLNSGIFYVAYSTNSGTLNVTGNVNISGGTFNGTFGNGNATVNCAQLNLTVLGTINMIDGNGGGTGVPTITLTGNLNLASGTYNAQANGATNFPIINLNGTGGKTISGPALSDANHNVNLNGSYTLATNFTVGGTLNLNNAYTLNLNGKKATLNGGLSVVGSGGTFDASGTGSEVEFGSGTVPANLPGAIFYNLRINRPSQTISMLGDVIVSNDLSISAGTLSIGNNELTIQRALSASGTLLGGSSSNITISSNGVTSIGVFPSVTVNNLFIDRVPGVTLGGLVTVNGTLTLQAGVLSNPSNRLAFGNGATIIRNNSGTAGSLSVAPIFGTSVNVSYTGDVAILSTSTELPSSTTVLNNLTVNNSGGITVSGVRTVNGALTLTDGVLTLTGTLTLNLNSGYIANSGNGSILGDITCTKTINRSSYTMLGSPLTGTITFPSTSYFNLYNEPTHQRNLAGTDDAGWQTVSSTQTILAGNIMRGYSAYYTAGSTPLSVKGAYDHTADYSINLTNTNDPLDPDPLNDGWNIIANPFPSNFNFDGVTIPSQIDNQIHYWDGSAYQSYTSGAGGGSGTLAPFQAVFMRANTLGSHSLTFSKLNRVNGTKALVREGRSNLDNILVVSAVSGNLMDKSYVRLHNESTNKFDSKWDANKLDNDPQVPMLYTESLGMKYAINTFPLNKLDSNGMIALKIKSPISANYSFNFAEDAAIEENIQILLVDKLLNKTQDIRLNPIYNATINKEDTAARFFIVFKGEITAIEEAQDVFSASTDNKNVIAYFKNVNAKTSRIDLMNSMGQVVYSNPKADITTNKFSFTPNVANHAGVYILKAIVGNKVYTQKILLND